MAEDKKEKRRAYKTQWDNAKYAQSEAERQRKIEAALDRYRSESPEQRLRRNALWRQAWARRKRKADLAKMPQEQRDREVERWAKLAPEQKKAEDLLAIELHRRSTNAIDDLGTDTPDHLLSEEWSYARDKKVRSAVLRRAKGKCEFCGKPGFIAQCGKPYLETHHVISLANEGADRPTNVIALCPNDHREAHFGKRCAAIETEMIRILKAMKR
jgi:predicted restriction endonuclease